MPVIQGMRFYDVFIFTLFLWLTKMDSEPKASVPKRSRLMFVRLWKVDLHSAFWPQVKNSTNANSTAWRIFYNVLNFCFDITLLVTILRF